MTMTYEEKVAERKRLNRVPRYKRVVIGTVYTYEKGEEVKALPIEVAPNYGVVCQQFGTTNGYTYMVAAGILKLADARDYHRHYLQDPQYNHKVILDGEEIDYDHIDKDELFAKIKALYDKYNVEDFE